MIPLNALQEDSNQTSPVESITLVAEKMAQGENPDEEIDTSVPKQVRRYAQ